MSKVYVTPKVKTETSELGVFGCYGGSSDHRHYRRNKRYRRRWFKFWGGW